MKDAVVVKREFAEDLMTIVSENWAERRSWSPSEILRQEYTHHPHQKTVSIYPKAF